MTKPVIICVDDENIILTSLKQQLVHRLGQTYAIELAESGEEALELIDELVELGVEIPLIITDYIMPGMYGDELLVQAKEIIPAALSIMLTGQATASAVGEAVNRAALFRYISKPWHEEDLLLTVATALESYHQKQELQRRDRFRKMLGDVIALALTPDSLQLQLNRAMDCILSLDEFAGDGNAAVYLVDPEQAVGEPIPKFISQGEGLFPKAVDAGTFVSGKRGAHRLVEAQSGLVNQQDLAVESVSQNGTAYQIPLCYQEHLLGVLQVGLPRHSKPLEQMSHLLVSIADTLASMIQLTQYHMRLEKQNEELEAMVKKRTEDLDQALAKQSKLNEILLDANKQLGFYASMDSLTGLYNRRHFLRTGNDEVERSQRYNRSIALMMIDVDFFKDINDQYGHSVGDQALEQIARLLQSQTRKVDIIGRIGGEEFAVVLPESPLEQAYQLAERIRSCIEAAKIICHDQTLQVTISVGVTPIFEDETSIERAMVRADAALYRSKQEGRNRVTVAETRMVSHPLARKTE